jgi:hypothetical protein
MIMKSFSRSSLVLASGVALASLVGFTSTAQAQSLTDSTIITVDVGGILEITSAPDNAGLTLTATEAIPSAAQPIGDVNVRSNKKDGFTLTVSSLYDGKLRVNTAEATPDYDIPYQVQAVASTSSGTNATGTFEAAFAPTTGGVLAFTSDSFKTLNCAPSTGCNVGFEFTITDTTARPEGSYTDTITYTLAAN